MNGARENGVEPVAWQVVSLDRHTRKIILTEPDAVDWQSVTPLYAHPPAASPAGESEAVVCLLMQLLHRLDDKLARKGRIECGTDLACSVSETLQFLKSRHASSATQSSNLRHPVHALLEACTKEYGWSPSALDADPVSEDSVITWGHLRAVEIALKSSTTTPPADMLPDDRRSGPAKTGGYSTRICTADGCHRDVGTHGSCGFACRDRD